MAAVFPSPSLVVHKLGLGDIQLQTTRAITLFHKLSDYLEGLYEQWGEGHMSEVVKDLGD